MLISAIRRVPPRPRRPDICRRLFSVFRYSFDVVSAESVVRLFKDGAVDDFSRSVEAKEVAVGLTDRREYNGFVPLMDEKDPLKTAVMRIFSGLQVVCFFLMFLLLLVFVWGLRGNVCCRLQER